MSRERVIELKCDPSDGVFKPSGVTEERKPKQKRPVRVKQSKQRMQVRQVTEQLSQLGNPKVNEFLQGVNIAFDIWERLKRVSK